MLRYKARTAFQLSAVYRYTNLPE